jgi:hypothetical protein
MPHAAAPEPAQAQKAGACACSTGTPDWLRTRFFDGFAAHEFG